MKVFEAHYKNAQKNDEQRVIFSPKVRKVKYGRCKR